VAAPAILRQTGTGTVYWLPAGTATIDATWDDIGSPADVNSVSASNASWWNLLTSSANGSAICTTPVQAFRVVMATCVATSVVAVTFLQGTRGLP
jgi:hypothetical protein